MCGQTIDRYELLEWVGGGGFGAVYKARHKVMHRTVALKLVRPSVHQPTDVIERFVTEARAAASIGNPHIIEVYDAGSVADGTHFLAMELIDGCSLGDVLEAEEPLPVPRAGRILLQVLDALIAAHEASIIHRDIKPGNIMLVGSTPGGEARDFVKLLDFGISKAVYLENTPTTKTGMSMGTPGYAAPEQYMAAKSVDHRADVYAAGVVLYKMLAGRLPFEAESYEEMVVRVCTTEPEPLRAVRPDLPSSLVSVVERAMRTKPLERYPSARDFQHALRSALDGTDEAPTMQSGPVAIPVSGQSPISASGPIEWSDDVVSAASSPEVPIAKPGAGRGRWIALAGAMLLVAIASGVGVSVWLSGALDGPAVTPTPPSPVVGATADQDPDEDAPSDPEGDPTPGPEGTTPTATAPPDPGPEAVPPVAVDSDSVTDEVPTPQGRRGRRGRTRRGVVPPVVDPDPTPTTMEPRADPYARPDLVPFDP